MKLATNSRAVLASLLDWTFRSSRRAGTRMNRLVRWIDPTPRVRTLEQGGIPFKKLHARALALTNARTAVNNLISHKQVLLHGKEQLTDEVFHLLKTGQRFEARLLLERFLRENPGASKDGISSANGLNQLVADLNQCFEHNQNRNGQELTEVAALELTRAQEMITKDIAPYEASDDALYDAWAERYRTANKVVNSTMFNVTPETLLENILELTRQGKHLQARTLTEQTIWKENNNDRETPGLILNQVTARLKQLKGTSEYHRKLLQEAEHNFQLAYNAHTLQAPYPELDPERYPNLSPGKEGYF